MATHPKLYLVTNTNLSKSTFDYTPFSQLTDFKVLAVC